MDPVSIAPDGYRDLRDHLAWGDAGRRRIVLVAGEDAVRFVDGFCTASLAALALTTGAVALSGCGESDAQVTVFDSVGFALEDLSALRYVHALSQKLGVGSTVQLVPEMADPKDLFACATAARPVLRKAA